MCRMPKTWLQASCEENFLWAPEAPASVKVPGRESSKSGARPVCKLPLVGGGGCVHMSESPDSAAEHAWYDAFRLSGDEQQTEGQSEEGSLHSTEGSHASVSVPPLLEAVQDIHNVQLDDPASPEPAEDSPLEVSSQPEGLNHAARNDDLQTPGQGCQELTLEALSSWDEVDWSGFDLEEDGQVSLNDEPVPGPLIDDESQGCGELPSELSGFSLIPSAAPLPATRREECDLTVFQQEVASASHSVVGAAALADVARFAPLSDIVLPWESSFARAVLSDRTGLEAQNSWTSMLHLPPPLPREQPQAVVKVPGEPRSTIGQGPVFTSVVALRAAAVDPSQERQIKHGRAVLMWAQILFRFQDRSSIYNQIASEGEVTVELLKESVSASVGVRSPFTVHKRAGSFSAFIRWLDIARPAIGSKVHERHAWEYVQDLKAQQAAPSKASSFLSSVRFAHFVLGLEIVDDLLSNRVSGLSAQMLAEKRKLQQSATLTVSQALELHALLESGTLHRFDRVIVAAILIRLYARARHGDLLYIEDVSIDEGEREAYIEFTVSQHKGARGARQKAQFLPILVPMIGVNGKSWLREALDAFEAIGRPLTAVRGPLLVAPTDADATAYGSRALSSAEMSKSLRAFLGQPENPGQSDGQKINSHSLKATCLSWASKWGLTDFDKAVLGRHASCAKTSQAIYSRDLCAGPVRKLQQIIVEISSAQFRPDCKRSSYFAFPPQPPAMVAPASGHAEDDRSNSAVDQLVKSEPIDVPSSEEEGCAEESRASDESSSSEGSDVSSSDSSSSGNESGGEAPVAKRFRKASAAKDGRHQWYVHCKSRKLHLVVGQEDVRNAERVLACGRPLRSTYKVAAQSDLDACCECRTCRRAM